MRRTQLFSDRTEAGVKLAHLVCQQVKKLPKAPNPVVYALPRGGIPVAVPVAHQLDCPLSVAVSKKITLPKNPELALGAATPDGDVVWGQPSLLRNLTVAQLEKAMEQAHEKAQQQWLEFSSYCPQINPEGKIAILVDDGIATGMTMIAAAQEMRKEHAREVWLAAPVAPRDLLSQLSEWSDRLIVVSTPYPFLSVSRFYVHFPQVDTKEAIHYLQEYNQQLLLL